MELNLIKPGTRFRLKDDKDSIIYLKLDRYKLYKENNHVALGYLSIQPHYPVLGNMYLVVNMRTGDMHEFHGSVECIQLDGLQNKLTNEIITMLESTKSKQEVIDGVYRERNILVSFLSKLYPASLERHVPDDDPNWDEEWKWVVFIDSPCGQLTWHIHDKELLIFNHLNRNTGRVWDGHTKEEKYHRLMHCFPEQLAYVNHLEDVISAISDINPEHRALVNEMKQKVNSPELEEE